MLKIQLCFEHREDNIKVFFRSVEDYGFRMQGRLFVSTFGSLDWHEYYKITSDALRTKLYFRCKMNCKGCRAILHTEYVDRDDDNLSHLQVWKT